jgi:HD superfamily phosphohydrolase
MHIAGRLFEAVVASSESILRETYSYTEAGFSRDWQIVRLAALLHDVGHPPFSHATEKLLPMKGPEQFSLYPGEKAPEQFKHEDYSVAIIENIFGDVIEQHPINRRNAKITPLEVMALIAKRAPGDGTSLFWKDIISGQLDADRMDYLLRDSLHAGVSYGKFDLDRIVACVCAIRRPIEESKEPKIAIAKGGAYAAEALIVARYWMHKQVYFHKTRLACDHHLENAVRSILIERNHAGDKADCYPRPDSSEQLAEFLKLDDHWVMGLIVGGHGGEHGQRLMERNHYRLVCELVEESDSTALELSNSAKRNAAIVESLGQFVTHVTQPKTPWYKTKADDLILVEDESKQQIGFLSAHSALLRSINYGSIQFVYADRSKAKDARELYKSFLEKESEAKRTETPEIGSPPKIGPEAVTTETSQLTLSPPAPKAAQQKGMQNAG